VQVEDRRVIPGLRPGPTRPGFEDAARTRGEVVESEVILACRLACPGHYFLKMGFVTDHGQTLVGRFELPPEGDDVLVTLPDSFSSVSRPRSRTRSTCYTGPVIVGVRACAKEHPIR